MIISWLKCTSYVGLSQPWCQNVLLTITLDLVGNVSVLRHYFYDDLALCNSYLYLLTNAVQLVLASMNQLRLRIAKVFISAVSLFFFAVYIDKNCG